MPGERAGREGFIIAIALLAAVLALTFTLGWVVFHQIVDEAPPPADDVPSQGPLTGGDESGGGDGAGG